MPEPTVAALDHAGQHVLEEWVLQTFLVDAFVGSPGSFTTGTGPTLADTMYRYVDRSAKGCAYVSKFTHEGDGRVDVIANDTCAFLGRSFKGTVIVDLVPPDAGGRILYAIKGELDGLSVEARVVHESLNAEALDFESSGTIDGRQFLGWGRAVRAGDPAVTSLSFERLARVVERTGLADTTECRLETLQLSATVPGEATPGCRPAAGEVTWSEYWHCSPADGTAWTGVADLDGRWPSGDGGTFDATIAGAASDTPLSTAVPATTTCEAT